MLASLAFLVSHMARQPGMPPSYNDSQSLPCGPLAYQQGGFSSRPRRWQWAMGEHPHPGVGTGSGSGQAPLHPARASQALQHLLWHGNRVIERHAPSVRVQDLPCDVAGVVAGEKLDHLCVHAGARGWAPGVRRCSRQLWGCAWRTALGPLTMNGIQPNRGPSLTLPISMGSPARSMGVRDRTLVMAALSATTCRSTSVMIDPGPTAFTRMEWGARDSAMARVRLFTPPLDAL